MTVNINLYNQDCLEAMRGMGDNEYSLAICDPPYGHGKDIISNNKTRGSKARPKDYGDGEWNNKAPSDIYFKELKRMSKNQIIWGGNYFKVEPSSCWVVWDKNNGNNDFADCELAWTSFGSAVRKFKFTWNGMIQENMKNKEIRIHACQKPVALYKWILRNYAKEGDTILDTHGGSMSIVIACIDLGFSIDCYEIDKDYFDASVKRIKTHLAQGDMFRKEIKLNVNYKQKG